MNIQTRRCTIYIKQDRYTSQGLILRFQKNNLPWFNRTRLPNIIEMISEISSIPYYYHRLNGFINSFVSHLWYQFVSLIYLSHNIKYHTSMVKITIVRIFNTKTSTANEWAAFYITKLLPLNGSYQTIYLPWHTITHKTDTKVRLIPLDVCCYRCLFDDVSRDYDENVNPD